MRADKLTKDELKDLGCKLWDDGLMALTPEVLKDASDNTVMSVLDSNVFQTKAEWLKKDGFLDNDTRFGCTPYVVKV